MHNWFSKNLGDAMMAYEEIEELKKHIMSIFQDTVVSDEMAVFIRHESDGHLHCEVKIYFSPSFSDFARELDIKPCIKPEPDSLGLLVGNENSRLLLFPKIS